MLIIRFIMSYECLVVSAMREFKEVADMQLCKEIEGGMMQKKPNSMTICGREWESQNPKMITRKTDNDRWTELTTHVHAIQKLFDMPYDAGMTS